MIYMLWQFDTKAPLSESIQTALDYHEKKYGEVPNIIEHGIEDRNSLPIIDGIRYHPIQIPQNILLLAVERGQNEL